MMKASCTALDVSSGPTLHSGGVDPFALIILGIVVALLVWVLILGRFHPRSTVDVLDWRPTRSPELEAQNEIDDLQQMLDATNERRRRRGEPELTEHALREEVAAAERQQFARREAYLAEVEVDQMLAAKNERRRRRGEPELTAEQYRAQLATEQQPRGRREDERPAEGEPPAGR